MSAFIHPRCQHLFILDVTLQNSVLCEPYLIWPMLYVNHLLQPLLKLSVMLVYDMMWQVQHYLPNSCFPLHSKETKSSSVTYTSCSILYRNDLEYHFGILSTFHFAWWHYETATSHLKKSNSYMKWRFNLANASLFICVCHYDILDGEIIFPILWLFWVIHNYIHTVVIYFHYVQMCNFGVEAFGLNSCWVIRIIHSIPVLQWCCTPTPGHIHLHFLYS